MNFAGHFCGRFFDLQAKGHPKWKALTWKPGSPLPPLAAGWQYSPRVKEQLSRCHVQEDGGGVPVAAPAACKPQDRFAGLCR